MSSFGAVKRMNMPGKLNSDATSTLQLHCEELEVTRRCVTGQTVRVSTRTTTHDQHVDEPLTQETVQVERVVIGRAIETVPPVRVEGDVTIIPVVEEILVVERRLILKEEIHMRRVRTIEHHRETVILRRQEVEVTRLPPSAGSDIRS